MTSSCIKSIADPCLLLFVCLSPGDRLSAQPSLSPAMLKPLRGPSASFGSLTEKDSIVLLLFWATGSQQSIDELNAITAKDEKWKQLGNFKMMAVCVDEGKDVGRVRPMVNAYGWIFDVYIDINGDLRKTLKSVNLPQSVILYKGQVVYQQSGFEAGSENYLIKRIQALGNAK